MRESRVSTFSVSWFAANGVCDEYHVIRHCMNLEAVNTYEGKPVLVSYPDHIILLPHVLGMRLVSGSVIFHLVCNVHTGEGGAQIGSIVAVAINVLCFQALQVQICSLVPRPSRVRRLQYGTK